MLSINTSKTDAKLYFAGFEKTSLDTLQPIVFIIWKSGVKCYCIKARGSTRIFVVKNDYDDFLEPDFKWAKEKAKNELEPRECFVSTGAGDLGVMDAFSFDEASDYSYNGVIVTKRMIKDLKEELDLFVSGLDNG